MTSMHPQRLVLLYDRKTGEVLDYLAEGELEAILVVNAFTAPGIVGDRCGRRGERGECGDH